MKYRISNLKIRRIFNSGGGWTFEVIISVNDGWHGVGSAPSALKPGRLEKPASGASSSFTDLEKQLKCAIKDVVFDGQYEFDDALNKLNDEYRLGSDLMLSMSIAFCRACASKIGIELYQYISALANSSPKIPFPMINVFSGGIHAKGQSIPFQQVMLIPTFENLISNFDTVINIYSSIESRMKDAGRLLGYSSSSGMIVNDISIDEVFNLLDEAKSNTQCIKYGVDIAAEHLKLDNGYYMYEKVKLTSHELLEEIKQLIYNRHVFYVEDPFDPGDTTAWEQLMKCIDSALIVGDDLFATNADNISPDIANGILLKMNQIGTISGTLQAAKKARSYGFTLCVSHRSIETDDTAMCDLAVGVGAEYIKIGGPRRGDRISKYNRLIRIYDSIC